LEPAYNDIGLYDTSPIGSDICGTNKYLAVNRNIMLLGYNDTLL